MNSSNYGHELYKKGLKKLYEKENKFWQAMLQWNQEEESNLTFQPEINPISRFFGRPENSKPEDYLISKGRETKEKLEMKRYENMYEEQKKCKFRPKVNWVSE